jgi:cytochrome P450
MPEDMVDVWHGAIDVPPCDAKFRVPTPKHVPPELIRPYPYILGAKTKLRPHSFIHAIHAENPQIFWAERANNGIQGAWIPRKQELLNQIYLDSKHFTVRDSAPFARLIGESWFSVPSEVDPPLHTLLRSMVQPVFAPKKMAELEGRIRKYAQEYVRGFRDKGACDFMADFAFEFPIKVFLELMGLPQERVGQFLAWEHKLLHEPDINEVITGTRAVIAYLREEIADRRARPREDLITFGAQVERDGRKLTEDELVGFCFNLFIGGLDTVSTNMAWQFHHLAEHLDDQITLRNNPAMIPTAIEELMRFYAAVATVRECTETTELGGVTMLPGDKVLLPTYLAGRDPQAYHEPETVILNRAPRHVSFGSGPHLCIGMHLARREMRIALEEFLREVRDFQLAPRADITYYLAAIIQPVQLPLVWG